jgi:hypothetical protein
MKVNVAETDLHDAEDREFGFFEESAPLGSCFFHLPV